MTPPNETEPADAPSPVVSDSQPIESVVDSEEPTCGAGRLCIFIFSKFYFV